ncbi:MAG: ABC transporter permease subunit [Galbitalea sp.]
MWLPSGASAFNVVLVMRFFDSLPREIFEAAQTDGAGPFRLFWSIVLPMSKPVIGVVTVFAIINAWKDFLWPNLVLPGGSDPASVQPLSVRLPAIQGTTELGPFLASLAIATLIPIILFLCSSGPSSTAEASGEPSRGSSGRHRIGGAGAVHPFARNG